MLYATSYIQGMDLHEFLSPGRILAVTVAVKAVDTWLRMLTTTPVGGATEDLGAE